MGVDHTVEDWQRVLETNLHAPLAILAELTHRCPLQCPYCSNPLDLTRASHELDTKTWTRVFDEAAFVQRVGVDGDLGVGFLGHA